MKVTMELTPESVAKLKEFAEDLFRRIQAERPGEVEPAVVPVTSEVLTVDEFVEDPKQETKEEPKQKTYTLEEVRAKLTELSRGGKREAVNQLINSYGAKRLTDVPEEQYISLMEKAGEL